MHNNYSNSNNHFKHQQAMRKLYQTLAFVFVLMLAFEGAAWGQITGAATAKDSIQHGVILHCFDWKYTDIQAELKNIKDAGFTAIQTSPVQKNYAEQTVWNTLYRPRNSSEIGPCSLGTKSELQALCTAAHALGIKVIVDVVANHTDSNLSYAEGIWANSAYYHTWGEIDYGSRQSIINGKMGGLMDVNTSNLEVQSAMKAFVQNLKSIGVDGIRWDAAKHIGLPSEGDSFWTNVIDTNMFNYGEVLDGTGGDDSKLMPGYLSYMSITDNTYGTNMLLNSANNGSAPSGGGSWAFTYNSGKFVYWGESHDTYCNDNGASKSTSQEAIDRAYAIAASHNQIPALYLSRPTSSNPTQAQAGVKGSTHFTSTAVAEVNKFHNLMDGKADYYTGNGSVASSTRQGGGAIVVNFAGAGTVSIANGGGYATPGTYTDKVSGNTWTITSTTISGTTNATGIAVLYDSDTSAAGITLSPNGGTFTTETQTITITPNENTTSYWYQIGDDTRKDVSSKTPSTITIGEGVSYGTDITLSWGASNGTKETTGSATFTKHDPNAAIHVYVKANSAPNLYVWTGGTNSVELNGSWPGTQMSSSTTYSGWYEWSTTEANSFNIIFNNGNGTQTADIEGITSDVYYTYDGNTTATVTTKPDGGDTYEPALDKADETSCFFETSSDNVKVWIWDSSNNYTGGTWPGESMTLMGKAANGNNIFKWTYSGTLTTIPTGIIFTHDGGTKFNSKDGTFTNHGYYTENGTTTSTKTITIVATTINFITPAAQESDGVWYTITGVRLGGSPSQSGVYIHNGRKVVVRQNFH